MATEIPSAAVTDAELLYQYLGRRLGNGGKDQSIDCLLAEFAEYRRELDELRASLRAVEASSARGESRPLNVADVIRRGRERMAAEGILD
jgi:hypothetical protein